MNKDAINIYVQVFVGANFSSLGLSYIPLSISSMQVSVLQLTRNLACDPTAAAAKSLQSCPTLCDPIDRTPPGSAIPGILQEEHWSGLPFPSPMHEVKSESQVAQLCPTLRDPMDCSLPGSSIHGIFQARVLEWDAIAFSHLISLHPHKYFLVLIYFIIVIIVGKVISCDFDFISFVAN